MLVSHLPGTERRAVNPVSSGSSSHNDYQIAGLLILEALVFIHNADVAAEYQRVGYISVIEIDRPVNRGYPHSVAVIPHA